MSNGAIAAQAVRGLPEIAAGDDLGALIVDRLAADRNHEPLSGEEVLVVAHKAVSKAEGRVRALASVQPGTRARELGRELGKDPRHIQVVLDESSSVLRASRGVLIAVTHHGFVCANAGVDASNTAEPDSLIMLPTDPDASARALRARLGVLTGVRPAVLIADSFGRPWRQGQVDVAIGAAGLLPLDDWRGRADYSGRELHATWIAVADEMAAAADLARSKDGGLPVVVIRGAGRHVRAEDGPGAAALLRPEAQDMFR
ncbi:MAG: coenzyme F420-0:L-glutamate ligase [Solirubrobacteraceae bacterium]